MTLIELLIVLALLGGLATMALTGVGDLSASNRVRVTRQRLDNLRLAVVGDGLQAGRFLQDMGRFPMVQSTDAGKALSELWQCPTGLAAATVAEDLDDGSAPDWTDSSSLGLDLPEEVELSCGWNGPYITLGNNNLYDGFGNDFVVAKTSSPEAGTSSDWYSDGSGGDPPGTGTETEAVLSRGADGDFTDATWADTNQMVDFEEQSAAVSLVVTVKARDLSGDTPSWQTVSPLSVRTNSTAYSQGDCITDSSLNYVFQCTATTGSSTSDSSEPTWAVDTPSSSTTTDNDVTWTYLGPIARFPYLVNRLRIALFVPVISKSSKSIGWVRDWQSGTAVKANTALDDSSQTAGGVTALRPGLRKLYVYGFVTDDSTATNAHAGMAEPQEIMLQPGTNHVTVYLAHPLMN